MVNNWKETYKVKLYNCLGAKYGDRKNIYNLDDNNTTNK